MPHAELVAHSTQLAKHTGDLHVGLHKLRTAGLSAPAMRIVSEIEAAMANVSNLNAAIGEIAHQLGDEMPEAEKPASAPAPTGIVAPVEPPPKVEANLVKDPAKR